MTLIEEIKAIMQRSASDEYLNVMVPLLEDYVKAECNNTFRKNGKTVYPGGVKIFIAKACEHNLTVSGVSSKRLGTVSYSYDLDFPESLRRLLNPYRRVRFHAF